VAVAADGTTPFNLPLSLVLGKMPQKEYLFDTVKRVLTPLFLPVDVTPAAALSRVLRLLDVGSKRFLTNKVGVLLCILYVCVCVCLCVCVLYVYVCVIGCGQ
jgi:hypothetical protein